MYRCLPDESREAEDLQHLLCMVKVHREELGVGCTPSISRQSRPPVGRLTTAGDGAAEQPARKPTSFLSSSPAILEELGRRRSRQHRH